MDLYFFEVLSGMGQAWLVLSISLCLIEGLSHSLSHWYCVNFNDFSYIKKDNRGVMRALEDDWVSLVVVVLVSSFVAIIYITIMTRDYGGDVIANEFIYYYYFFKLLLHFYNYLHHSIKIWNWIFNLLLF